MVAYRQSRETLLTGIVNELSDDQRFVAAWLTGSYGRDDADEMSDLDLSVVVAEAYSQALCSRQEHVNHKTADERFVLFSKFGEPALLHENNRNAPEGGTFTFVMYAGSAIMVDWVLIPLSKAERPRASRLLFDKAGIPFVAPRELEEREQSKENVAEQWAFFWMMAAITVKYINRGDAVFVTGWLEHLHEVIRDTERRIQRKPWKYRRGSLSSLQATPEMQLQAVRSLCKKMEMLTPRVAAFCGAAPALPLKEIETLLVLAEQSHARH